MRQEGRSIMPIIYLSPSTQEWNMYVTGSGSEEYNMNLWRTLWFPICCPMAFNINATSRI